MNRIGFIGTDARTLQSALVVSMAKSEIYKNNMQGVVIGGSSAMPEFSKLMNWPVEFISTEGNSVDAYAEAIVRAMKKGEIDYVVPMPESLLFEGLINEISAYGFDFNRWVVGLTEKGSFLGSDKIACNYFCKKNNIPVADEWIELDIKTKKGYQFLLDCCLDYCDRFGGAVLRYPYSAGGRGTRIIKNPWEIRDVYEGLMHDYKDDYKEMFGSRNPWPLLIESFISGIEISFTVLVDKNGGFQILPTAMGYPERFEGVSGKDNPITDGMGSISPHPIETDRLKEMFAGEVAVPLIEGMEEIGILRPCILNFRCFISLDSSMRPTRIRVSEINICPGEPELQTVVRRLRNFGVLIKAMFDGNLHEVSPEVREDQIAICLTLAVGPNDFGNQKGYPWSYAKGEQFDFNLNYLNKKKLQLIPSAMKWDEREMIYKSDGGRVAYLNANTTKSCEALRRKMFEALQNNEVQLVSQSRFAVREDVGFHYESVKKIFG